MKSRCCTMFSAGGCAGQEGTGAFPAILEQDQSSDAYGVIGRRTCPR